MVAACGSPEWEQICANLAAKSEECGQITLQHCTDNTFSDCGNEDDVAEQLEGCAESCTALAACTHIVCEE